ncbi:uncharacterized protein Dwil_GK21735 [Drosophila willistoni]|uniref:GK21735 n=1 Tax=Drosophila willistoni TaxID=7260 RepID=B4MPN3_DROWI|nr:mitochondrial sodium/calcium exchanger protein [Drosophila willistoni]EDW74072.1 uncharacterized protein Dwil_GK21735 [Drosophila willistoni]
MENTELEPNDMDEEFNSFWDKVSCYVVTQFPYRERCDFVQNATDCIAGTHFVPYMRILACDFKCVNQFQELVFITLFVLLCFLLLLCLGHVVDMYYGPALKVVSRMMHMNEHLAGVTLLAFGNTSPDLFANLSNFDGDNPVFANSLSTALFVSMFTGGLVCYISPFKMNAHGTIRDVLFFILGVSLLEYVLYSDDQVTISECYIMVMVYIFYLVVNILDVYLMRISMKHMLKEIESLRDQRQTPEVRHRLEYLENKYDELAEDEKVEILERTSGVNLLSVRSNSVSSNHNKFAFTTKVKTNRQSVDINAKRNVFYNLTHNKNRHLFREFFQSLTPIDCVEWGESSMFIRAYLLAKVPVVLLCALYIPLVDFELDKNGWSKLLNVCHIFINPFLTVVVFKALLLRADKKQLWYTAIKDEYMYGVYTFVVTIPAALFVLCHARTDVPPGYHWLYTIMNLTGSMFLIFVCASEIDLLLEVIGNILGIDNDFMGVTVNSVTGALGDLVANSAMATQGYEKMAYAAAIGGPFFTVLMATGAVLYVKILNGQVPTQEDQTGEYGLNAYIFLNLGLFATLLWTSTLNFYARRSIGIFSMGIYALYIFFAILIWQGIVHSYAKDASLKDAFASD